MTTPLLANADATRIPLADESVDCIITSPPYWSLRKYDGQQERIWGGVKDCRHEWGGAARISMTPHHLDESVTSVRGGGHKKASMDTTTGRYCSECSAWHGSLGLEPDPDLFVAHLVEVFREVRRVLKATGTVWLDIGDSYANPSGSPKHGCSTSSQRYGRTFTAVVPPKVGFGLKPKDLCLIPARLSLALQRDGWWIRSQIIWHKPNVMPESCKDRPTTSHEYILLLTKRAKYYYDAEAVRETRSDGNTARFKAIQRHGGTYSDNAVAAAKLEESPYSDQVTYRGLPGVGTTFGTRNPTDRNRRTVWTIPTAPYHGVAVNGNCRIASPDCLAHDYQADLARVLEHDAQQDAFPFDCNPDTYAHLSQAQEGAVVSIPLYQFGSLFDESFAIPHNMRSRRTAGELERDVIFFGIPSSHTEYKQLVSHCAAKFHHMPLSNIWAGVARDAPDFDPSAQIFYRILSIGTFANPPIDCSCHYTGKIEKRQDHFAVFPTALPDICIRAGSSEHGCCAACGRPWERVIERHGKTHYEQRLSLGGKQRGDNETGHSLIHAPGLSHDLDSTQRATTGWRPTCSCYRTRNRRKRAKQDMETQAVDFANGLLDGETFDGAFAERASRIIDHLNPGLWRNRIMGSKAPTVPAVICDPFIGSGSTLIAARRLGRQGIGLDLSFPYLRDQARPRLELDRLDDWGRGREVEVELDGLPLFAGEE